MKPKDPLKADRREEHNTHTHGVQMTTVLFYGMMSVTSVLMIAHIYSFNIKGS